MSIFNRECMIDIIESLRDPTSVNYKAKIANSKKSFYSCAKTKAIIGFFIVIIIAALIFMYVNTTYGIGVLTIGMLFVGISLHFYDFTYDRTIYDFEKFLENNRGDFEVLRREYRDKMMNDALVASMRR